MPSPLMPARTGFAGVVIKIKFWDTVSGQIGGM